MQIRTQDKTMILDSKKLFIEILTTSLEDYHYKIVVSDSIVNLRNEYNITIGLYQYKQEALKALDELYKAMSNGWAAHTLS